MLLLILNLSSLSSPVDGAVVFFHQICVNRKSSLKYEINPLANPTFTGTVSGITATMVGLGNVTNESKATMFASPTFTGTTVAPTPTGGDSSTKIATTAYVQTAGYNSQGVKTVSTSDPSGGADGDIWYKYTA